MFDYKVIFAHKCFFAILLRTNRQNSSQIDVTSCLEHKTINSRYRDASGPETGQSCSAQTGDFMVTWTRGRSHGCFSNRRVDGNINDVITTGSGCFLQMSDWSHRKQYGTGSDVRASNQHVTINNFTNLSNQYFTERKKKQKKNFCSYCEVHRKPPWSTMCRICVSLE